MSSTAASVLSFARPLSPPRLISFDAEPQRAEIDLSRTALVVVDMQNDFLHPDGWFPRLGFDPAPLASPHFSPTVISAGVDSASGW